MKFKAESNASIFKRLFAFVIDILIVDLVLLWPFDKVLSSVFSGKISASSLAEIMSGKYYLIFSVTLVFFLYFVLFEQRLGQTIGKMLVNIYSVSKQGEMSTWQAIGKNLFLIPAIPFIFLWVIDPVLILFRNESLSEILTRTKTIEQKAGWQSWMAGKA